MGDFPEEKTQRKSLIHIYTETLDDIRKTFCEVMRQKKPWMEGLDPVTSGIKLTELLK